MTISEALTQLKAFARIDGAIVAALWTASFAATLLSPTSAIGSTLALATPFVVGARTISFRDHALDGVISVRRGAAHAWFTVAYASILFAVVQYAYFRFFDHGSFSAMITEAGTTLTLAYKAQGMDTKTLTESIEMLAGLTPIQYALLFMSQNLCVGTLLCLPIALVCRRSVPRRPKRNHRFNP